MKLTCLAFLLLARVNRPHSALESELSHVYQTHQDSNPVRFGSTSRIVYVLIALIVLPNEQAVCSLGGIVWPGDRL